ncbi:ATP-grasp domain-containing protein [Paenibacillus sp. MCAF9]|uniref:ATP-grasp domain-containing protein n=1 Tax=unclassified Paenibacillus TaxID=185978 RepID=UPI0030CDCA71
MKANELNLLFTSSGRRVSLIKKFKEAYALHGINGKIVTADVKTTAPTAFMSDRHVLVPRVVEQHYLETLLAICVDENIHLLIPLIDSELVLLAANRSLFEEIGVKLLLSSSELNEITFDKEKTYRFFSENDIRTPKVYSEDEIHEKNYQFPLMIKPRNGSSSQGVTKIKNEKELHFFKEYIPNAMIQEFVTGEEYTIDVMVDFFGNIKTIVPRLRLETRAGEVSKGITMKNQDVINAAEHVVRALPGPVGCITLQCFKQANGEITFIEINPRFGGGVPLAIEAGADFPLWTIRLGRGETLDEGQDNSWCDQLTMLRYDEAIFTKDISYDH